MTRVQLPALELLGQLNRELHAADEAFFACRFTVVETLESPDGAGCNWRSARLQCVGADEEEARRAADEIVARARSRFNVKP